MVAFAELSAEFSMESSAGFMEAASIEGSIVFHGSKCKISMNFPLSFHGSSEMTHIIVSR